MRIVLVVYPLTGLTQQLFVSAYAQSCEGGAY